MPHTEVSFDTSLPSPSHSPPPQQRSTGPRQDPSTPNTSEPTGAGGRELHARKLEALGRLSGCVAHDFNNLLTVILGATGSLLQTPPQGDPMEAIHEIHDSALRARQLTRQILAASRPSDAEPHRLDVSERLRDLLGLLGRLMGDRMQVHHEFHPDLPQVLMDPGHLDQVMINLAVNARDAMQSRGILEVRATPHSGPPDGASVPGVRIEVQDTGGGMDLETQRRIFEPFFTTKGGEGGTGLGLATVLRIVEKAGGHLGVDSEPGRGTTVTLWLPAAPSQESKAGGPGAGGQDDEPEPEHGSRSHSADSSPRSQGEEEATPSTSTAGISAKSRLEPSRGMSARSPGSSARILLVEDDPSVRRLVGRVLRSSGYQVREAAGMKEAVELATLGDASVDLIVADLMLPDGSGLELLDILRTRDPEGRPPRTVLMSGYTRDEVAAEVLSNPEVRFLAKPFQVEELTAVVQEALEMRPGHSA